MAYGGGGSGGSGGGGAGGGGSTGAGGITTGAATGVGFGSQKINGQRGIRFGGYPFTQAMDYWSVQHPANALAFADMAADQYDHFGSSDGVRCATAAGPSPTDTDKGDRVQYINFMTPANSIDWGELNVAGRHGDSLSGGSRAMHVTGYNGSANVQTMEKWNMASLGSSINYYQGKKTEAQYDFGCGSDGVRGLTFGGEGPGGETTTIDFFSIYSDGDAIDFGDLLSEGRGGKQLMHGARGFRAGGDVNNTQYDGIEVWEIGTLGNASDHGELTQGRYYAASTSDGIRNVTVSGTDPGVNTMDYHASYSAGSAIDFGDLTETKGRCGSSGGG